MDSKVKLALLAFVAYIPFLNLRVLRMAGDEKVYLSQSIEMARHGTWFAQTLADVPSYFKGPLHYLCVRLGMILFGNQLLAGTWMNLAFALVAAGAMGWVAQNRWGKKAGLLLATMTLFNVGVYSHAFASQMEVEVYAFYALATAGLALRNDWLFWISAGLAGWSKSPLHSVLIGSGGILYWLFTKSVVSRIQSKKAWMALASGIAVGIAGYLPAAFLDGKNFYESFLLREQFEKANNGRSWSYVMTPLLHFALPWTAVLGAALVACFSKKSRKRIDRQMTALSLAMMTPTFVFWCTWTYKGQNYNLPTLPTLFLFSLACLNAQPPAWCYRIVAALSAFLGVGFAFVLWHFSPLPQWWSPGFLVSAFAGIFFFSLVFWRSTDPRALLIGSCAFFIAFGSIIAPLGLREMNDAKAFVKTHPAAKIHYYNLDPSIWSEWGLLQLTLHTPIYGLHRPEQLTEATQPGHAVVVQNEEVKKVVLDYWYSKNQDHTKKPEAYKWRRWLTKGRDSSGESQWGKAWSLHSLAPLEREFQIILF